MDDPKNAKKRKKIAYIAVSLILAGALGALILLSVVGQLEIPTQLKDYFLEKGIEETGSYNLVSSIYLGYRAMDTLGEIIVLMVTVAGVIAIMGDKR